MSEQSYWSNRPSRPLSRRQLLRGGAALGLGAFVASCGGDSLPRNGSSAASAPTASRTQTAAGTQAATATQAAAGTQAATVTQATAKQPKKGGTLRWGIEADVATLDPVWTTAFVSNELAFHLYDTLFIYDANLKPQPVLVKDFSVSPDNLTYTFNLREDATFEGGRPITSADVIASLQRWGKKAASGVSLFNAVNSLQPSGDRTFVLETKEPYGLVIDSFATGIGAPFIMTKEAASISADQQVNDVTASGPFRLESWTKGSQIVLKPRLDYKSPSGPTSNFAGSRIVYVDSIEIPIIPDDSSRLAALQAGTIDVMTQPTPDYLDQLKSNPQVQVMIRGNGAYDIVLLNNARPPFSNPLARQAVLAATDIDNIMTAGWGKNLWAPCPAIFLCGSPNESSVSTDQYNQKNLPKARQLFQQLVQSGGYDGRAVVILSNTTYPVILNESQVVKQMLESIGFKVDLQTPDWATAVSIRPSKDKWDMFLTNGPNRLGANDPLRSTPLNPSFFGWYQSAEMDGLKHEFGIAVTAQQQKAVIDKVQALWYRDVPDLLLGVGNSYDAVRSYVKGYTNTPNWAAFFNVWLDK
jgi:peptide/nickel transport system substrate-binding protein